MFITSDHVSEFEVPVAMTNTHRAALHPAALNTEIYTVQQAILQKAGKRSVLGSMEENEPDAADEEDDAENDEPNGQESDTIVDSLSNALQKTGLVSK